MVRLDRCGAACGEGGQEHQHHRKRNRLKDRSADKRVLHQRLRHRVRLRALLVAQSLPPRSAAGGHIHWLPAHARLRTQGQDQLRLLRNRQRHSRAGTSSFMQAFAAIRTVKCLVGEAFEVHRFKQALLQSNHRAIRYIALVSAFMAAFNFVQFGVYSLGMFLGK